MPMMQNLDGDEFFTKLYGKNRHYSFSKLSNGAPVLRLIISSSLLAAAPQRKKERKKERAALEFAKVGEAHLKSSGIIIS
jgi:hypothetical protein